MLKMLWSALSLFLLVNVLLLVAGAGYLYSTDRLNRDRLHEAAAIFEPTFAQEAQRAEQREQEQEEAAEKSLQLARLEAVSDGPVTMIDQLQANKQADELALQRVDRLRQEIADLRRQLEMGKRLIATQKADLEQQRQAFEQQVAEYRDRQQTENFEQAVALLEQLPPRQGKQMLQALLAEGDLEQVVDYLSAMQLRKAASVLREFKTEEEIRQAMGVIERLRERGIEIANTLGAPAAEEAS